MLYFDKYVWNLDLFNWEPKNSAFFSKHFVIRRFFLRYGTIQCFKYFFHMDNHIEKFSTVIFMEKL